VWEVARDFRETAQDQGAKVLKLQLAIPPIYVNTIQIRNFNKLSSDIAPNEYILTDQFVEVSESEIYDHVEVEIDCAFQEHTEKLDRTQDFSDRECQGICKISEDHVIVFLRVKLLLIYRSAGLPQQAQAIFGALQARHRTGLYLIGKSHAVLDQM
jgi:hypothetical protein